MQQHAPRRRAFYKYVSPETALAILRSRHVRYSSPLTFNDPFDIQSGLHFDFDLNTLHEKIVERIRQIAASPQEPVLDADDYWGRLVLEARKHYPTHGFPLERWNAITKAAFEPLIRVIHDTREHYERSWKEKILPGIRVFCVSEEPNSLLMWAHYGRDHTGAMFEFWSLPDEDNPLSVARPVEYKDSPPCFFSEREWIDDLTGVRKLDRDGLYHRYACTKGVAWAYEREWRVWYPLAEGRDLYEDMPIRHSEFRGVYLGCRADPAFSRTVIDLVSSSFPATKVLRARKREDAYALEYLEIQ